MPSSVICQTPGPLTVGAQIGEPLARCTARSGCWNAKGYVAADCHYEESDDVAIIANMGDIFVGKACAG